MTETQLIAEVIEKAKDRFTGWEEDETVIEEFTKRLKHLDGRVLGEILGDVRRNSGDLRNFMDTRTQSGTFKVNPHFVQGEPPMIVLRWNAFLHLHGTKTFQVSEDEDAYVAKADSGATLDREIESVKGADRLLRHSVIAGHLIEATQRFPEFREKINLRSTAVDDLVVYTNKQSNLGVDDFMVHEVLEQIKVESELTEEALCSATLIAPSTRAEYGGAFAKFSFGKDYIALNVFGSEQWYVIDFNDPNEICKDTEPEEYLMTVWKRLAWVLMFQARVFADSGRMYPQGRSLFVPSEVLAEGTVKLRNTRDMHGFLKSETDARLMKRVIHEGLASIKSEWDGVDTE